MVTVASEKSLVKVENSERPIAERGIMKALDYLRLGQRAIQDVGVDTTQERMAV